MKITAIPREDINSVSTRIRYYYFLRNLPEQYTWEKYRGHFGDVLYIQKAADHKTIKIAKKAKSLGIPIVYDCDDYPYSKPGKNRVKMLKLADMVTCDTVTRGEQLKKISGIRHYTVIPECVDYCDMLKPYTLRENVENILTFGNNAGTVNALKYMKASKLNRYYINSKKIAGAGTFIPWNLKTFISDLNIADICILIHPDDLKSNHKLLVCIAIGLPTIISDTKNYRDVYERIGLVDLIAQKPEDVPEIIEKIKSKKVRQMIVDRYASYPLSENNPKNVSRRLADVFKRVNSAVKYSM